MPTKKEIEIQEQFAEILRFKNKREKFFFDCWVKWYKIKRWIRGKKFNANQD